MRAILYVDGFNLYHAIDDLKDDRLKWLSLRSLAERIIQKKSETLAGVVYFSAYAHFRTPKDPSVVQRHRHYVAALQSTNVEIIMGNFKTKPKQCRKCFTRWEAHEEKETDVNIAVRLVCDAYQDLYDVAYVLSADTDLVPAMKCVRGVIGKSGTSKQVTAVFPPMQNRNVNSLIQCSDRQIKLNQNHIITSRFDDVVLLPDGSNITCPLKYK